MRTLRIDVPPGERAARVAWARLVEPRDKQALELIDRLGPEEALQAVQPEDRLGQRIAPRLETLDVARDVEIARTLGARIVVPGDDEWPTGFASLLDPPLCLWVRGPLELAAECERSVSVVGARAATQYGLRQAAEIAAGLVDRRFTVVSGAAYGIDGAAHRGALVAEGSTVAFTAGGIDRPYPRGHDDLFARLWRDGVVATEVPPGSAPTAVRFISRNRLIATVSQGTVVVEAGLRSGSLNTAHTASGCHRAVGAVPGSVESPVSAGCHQLIRDGAAVLVTDAAEVAELVGPLGELAPVKRGPERAGDEHEAAHRAVHAALLVRKAVTVEDLARRCGQSPDEVIAALGVLELSGLARRIPGEGWSKAAVSHRR
jgi:DNA processing protein